MDGHFSKIKENRSSWENRVRVRNGTLCRIVKKNCKGGGKTSRCLSTLKKEKGKRQTRIEPDRTNEYLKWVKLKRLKKEIECRSDTLCLACHLRDPI